MPIFILFSSCKKYNPNPDVAVKFSEDVIAYNAGGVDTLYVNFSDGYDDKGTILFSTYYKPDPNSYYYDNHKAEDFITIVKAESNYVIVKKITYSDRAGIIATLLNEARINSKDTLYYGYSAVLNTGSMSDKIVFTKAVSYYTDVFYMNPNGSGIVNFTNTPYISEQYPSISPLGKVAYYSESSSYGGYDTVYVANANGSNLFKRLAYNVTSLNFTPDGNYLCYVANGTPVVVDLSNIVSTYFVFPSSGSHSSTDYAHCAVYGTAKNTLSSYYASYAYDYYLDRNINGSNDLLDYTSSYPIKFPILSTSSAYALYVEEHSYYSILKKYDIVNGYSTVLEPSYSYSYFYRPDFNGNDTKIVYEVNYNGYSDLYIMNSDGTGKINITNTPYIDEKNPSWN